MNIVKQINATIAGAEQSMLSYFRPSYVAKTMEGNNVHFGVLLFRLTTGCSFIS